MVRWSLVALLVAASVSAQGAAAPSGSAPASKLVGDEDSGFSIYGESCRACHSGAIAPSLKGVAGRSIASVPGYSYSAGLQAKKSEKWTPQNLDKFLASPDAFAPGGKMKKRVVDAQERADLIAFLQSLSE